MSNAIHVTSEDFEAEVLKSDEPVVIDFWAPWCGPCRSIGPVLDDLAQRYAGEVKVAKVNVDEQPGLADAFKVSGIPTLYALNKGEVVSHMVGFSGPKALEDLFAKLSSGEEDEAAAPAEATTLAN